MPDAGARIRDGSRLLLVSELFGAPPDCGEKVLTCELAWELSASPGVTALWCDSGLAGTSPAVPVVTRASTGRLFGGQALAESVRRASPDAIVYVSRASETTATLVRARRLKRLAPEARVVLLAAQRGPDRGSGQRLLRRLLAPDGVLVLSDAHAESMRELECEVGVVRPGVDLRRFTVASPERRTELRKEAGIADDKPLVLHVGHLEAGRNLAWFEAVASTLDCTMLAVCSPTGADEPAVRQRLDRAGVRVVRRHFADVASVYQMADCYLFPVEHPRSAIETPLSVLEALACGVPVVSTPLGGLPEILHEGPAVSWARTETEAAEGVARMLAEEPDPHECRRAVEGLRWDGAARGVFEFAMGGGADA